MTATTADDFLAHYGILGMHWGQRKAEPVSSKKTSPSTPFKEASPAQKDLLLKVGIGAAAVAAAGIAIYTHKQVGNYKATMESVLQGERFANRVLRNYGKDSGKVFEKGTAFIRRSQHAETKMNLRSFVLPSGTSQKYDPNLWGEHEITITALKKMSSPSTKERIDLLAKAMPLPADDKFYARIAAEAAKNKSLGAKIALRGIGDKHIGAVQLSRITQSEWKSDRAKTFIEVLKGKGYSAVWDDWDKGDAHILFDSDAVKYVSAYKP